VPDSSHPSPRQVVERQLHAIATRDWPAMAALYAEHAIVELPFNRPAPLRLEGRRQLEQRNAVARDLPLELSPEHLVIHDTADPEVVVAEFDYLGRVTTTGRTFRVSNITVVRVRDGEITQSRDYHDHAVLNDVLGGNVPASLTGAQPTSGGQP
jgi:ketosteroid isomerase-like protein